MSSILVVVCYLVVGFIIVFALVMRGWIVRGEGLLAGLVVIFWIFLAPVACVVYAFSWMFNKAIDFKEKRDK